MITVLFAQDSHMINAIFSKNITLTIYILCIYIHFNFLLKFAYVKKKHYLCAVKTFIS